ncbi:DUF2218 domain-containing protein [Streptomyces sp. NPDC000941]
MTQPHSHAGASAGASGALEELYSSRPPWDIGRPQPALQALADAGAIRGRVLDVGCGTGEHTLLAAAQGLDATGIDLATNALHTAQGKARSRGLTARFLRHDARKLADLSGAFDTVLDSLVFHSFTSEDRAAYLRGLRTVLRPGGRYFMLGFSDRQPGELGRPHKLTAQEIRLAFAEGWCIDSIEPATIASTRHPDGLQGWLVSATTTGSSEVDDAHPAAPTEEAAPDVGSDMLTAQAHIPTDRASRYLVQLCRHGSQMTGIPGHRPRAHTAGGAPPRIRHVEWSDTCGVLDFGFGQCTLEAGPEGLTLRARADDEEHLRRIQDGIASRIEKIGRRDNLRVTWHRSQAPVTAPDDVPGVAGGPPAARSPLRAHGKTIGLPAVALLVLAVHLGAGRALVDSSWSSWGLVTILGIVAVKAAVMTTVVIRRRKTARARR